MTDIDENSIVDYLKAQGVPSDMGARRAIAERHGIVPYTGTADENIKLLALLRNPPLAFWEEVKAMFRGIVDGALK
jgi:hypothetical protein